MAAVWRNNGEKDGEGDYIIDVDPENGTQVQTFRGKSRKDVAEQVANAQFHSSRTIAELKNARVPEREQGARRLTPRPLSADERMRLVTEINDPAKFDSAVDRLLEAKYGSLEVLAQRENERIEQEEAARATAEAQKFMAQNADYVPWLENSNAIFDYIETNKLAVTATNLGIAWDKLKAEGKANMTPAPGTPAVEEPKVETAPVEGRRRAASYSTGLREGEASRTPQVERSKKSYTWADVDRMGSKEYERRLKEEPGFIAAMDKLGPRP